MHAAYERGLEEQRRVLLEIRELDRGAADYAREFRRLVSRLLAVTRGIEQLEKPDVLRKV